MILPCASRWMISIGWMTRQRTRTMSPAFTLDGTRMRILPMSLMALASAPADGHLHLALRDQQRAVALLDDGADVGRLAEADVGAHEGLTGLRRERRPRNDGDAVLVGDDPDALDVRGRRHRRVDLDADRHHGAVLGDGRDVELDQRGPVLHRTATEDALEPVLHGLLESERRRRSLGAGRRTRAQRLRDDGYADGAEPTERGATRDRFWHGPSCASTSTTIPRVLLRLEPERGRVGLESARQPERPAQVAGTGRGPRQREPLAVDLERLVGVHEDVAVVLVGAGCRHGHLLVPAVLAADRIR